MTAVISWHGLSLQQWSTLWDQTPWLRDVQVTLYEVARDRCATSEDRLTAMSALNEAITCGMLPSDPDFPEMMRDVMLEIVRGVRVPWFSRRRRTELKERLEGARWMLRTAYQFNDSEQPPVLEFSAGN